jgi:hypothetical protein
VRQQSWRQWFEYRSGLLEATPNAGHLAVASLVASGKLIIVNQQATEMDSATDLVIHAGIGETMEVALG